MPRLPMLLLTPLRTPMWMRFLPTTQHLKALMKPLTLKLTPSLRQKPKKRSKRKLRLKRLLNQNLSQWMWLL